MADTAAHLVDCVFPEVPVRQWVLTLPFTLRYRMAFDAGLTARVATAFVRTVFASLRRRARARRTIRHPHAGAVLFVQRYGKHPTESEPAHHESVVHDNHAEDQPLAR